MRTDIAQPIHLVDYRPPAYFIDEVRLEFRLEPSATRVKSILSIRRGGSHTEPLWLDGEGLKSISLSLDGRLLNASEYAIDGEGLTIHAVPGDLHPRKRGRDRSGGERRLDGALHLRWPVLHPMRG